MRKLAEYLVEKFDLQREADEHPVGLKASLAAGGLGVTVVGAIAAVEAIEDKNIAAGVVAVLALDALKTFFKISDSISWVNN